MEFVRDVDTILKKEYADKSLEEQLNFLKKMLANNRAVLSAEIKRYEKIKKNNLEVQASKKVAVSNKPAIKNTEVMSFVPVKEQKIDVSFYVSKIDAETELTNIPDFLPNKDTNDFENIINKIITHYTSIVSTTENFLLDCELEGMTQEELKDELEIIKFNQDIVELLKEYRDDLLYPEIKVLDRHSKIIFLETQNGNNLFASDLKSYIPCEFYPIIGKVLASFEDVSLKNIRRFQNDSNLAGTMEMRHLPSGIRIQFDKLANDTYILLGVTIKKATTTYKVSNFFATRKATYDKCKLSIIDKLGDETFLIQHEKYFDEIAEKIGVNTGGSDINERKNIKLHC